MLASDDSPYRVPWELAWLSTKALAALLGVAFVVAALVVGALTIIRRERETEGNHRHRPDEGDLS